MRPETSPEAHMPRVTAGLRWAIETRPNMYTPAAAPAAGMRASNPGRPPCRAAATTDPAARATSTNVPTASAANILLGAPHAMD